MRSKINLEISGLPTRHHAVIVLLFVCSIIPYNDGAPPESIGIPILKSILVGKSSDGLKELVQSHSSKLLSQLSSIDPVQSNSKDINNIINQLKPQEGRLDPVVTDVLSALDRKYRDTTAAAALESSTERFPDENASNRVASSTEENGIVWQDTLNRPQKRNRDSNRFSSRYRSKNKEAQSVIPNRPNISSDNGTEHRDASIPFNHVTDPNLRNHRLYDWEFETYKNFTHIDQTEDLMADEDHVTETKVAAAPPPIHPSQQLTEKAEKNKEDSAASGPWTPNTNVKSKRVKVKGIPHIVISLEDMADHGYGNGQESYKVHLPMDSGEHSMQQRPREPLRHSSTENIVYVHGDSGEVGRYPYSTLRDSAIRDVDDRYPDERAPSFRPSTSDLSDAVFMDPDEEFFTSTVRNLDGHGHLVTDQEISSETLPKRRRKKLKKISKKEELTELAQSSNRFNTRAEDIHQEDDHPYRLKDRANHGINYSPVYSKNSLAGSSINEDRARAHLGNIHHTPGPHLPLMKPSKFSGMMESTRMKSDRVLNTGNNAEEYAMMQGQPENPNYDQFDPSMHHDGGIGNYYSLHSDQSNPSAPDIAGPYGHKNNYDLTSTEYLGNGNRIQNALSALNLNNLFGSQQQATKKLQAAVADQVIAPGNVEDFYHPYAASDHQVNQYYEDSYSTSWSNTWFILAGLIAFTAIFALLLPMFLSSGRMGKKDHRHDLDDEDLNGDTFAGSSSNNYQYDNTNNDVNQNSDLWTEVKGVYNDLVNMFRGEYSLLSKVKKGTEGPKIVYRDEELEDDDSDEEEEEEEDDEKTDNKINIRNRKRNHYIKKQQKILQKQQQLELKRQQQQQQKQQQQQQQQQQGSQAKSHNGKKTLLSKSKVDAGSDNGKTINASSVNNLVVVSGPSGAATSRQLDDEQSSPRAVTGFILPDNETLATMAPMPMSFTVNTTGFGALSDSFLREWAQVQLINN